MVAASVGECAVSVVSEPISTTRDAAQLEAVIGGLAQLALHLPRETDALDSFGQLVRTDEFAFAKTYLGTKSPLREQVSALLMEPGPNFRIDGPWRAFIHESMVDNPLFWTKHVPSLFDADLAVRAPSVLVDAAKSTLAEVGGTSFFVSYLERVRDAKWGSTEN
eukprot:3483494-Prymnesium_polylepis.1